MSRRPPRGLSPEERSLWQKVTDSVVPLHPEQPRKTCDLPDAPAPRPHARPPLTRFQVGQRSALPAPPHDFAPDPAERLAHAPVRMDRKNFDRMKRGKLKPEARIDLHGMTLAQAHPALSAFILQAHTAQKRLVLVITGKGRDGQQDGPIPVRRGILKHQVPQWLASPPLGALVLQVTPAHQKHGGGGAYYVYLRRPRG
ncbi:Smr/MutS family protein [Actibacterium sp. D379-3]